MKMVINMKNKKMKIVMIGLVSILIFGGLSTTGIYNGVTEAIYANNEINQELAAKSENVEAIFIDEPLTSSFHLEGNLIKVHVIDQNGNNVKNALVEILGYDIEGSTGLFGNAWLITPYVNKDTRVTIRAEKRELSKEISIVIRNKQLYVSAPSSIDESETFNVFVRDQDGKKIIGAEVKFGDKTKSTNLEGKVVFTAPFVKKDTTYKIIASAPLRSYDDGEKQINIINKGVVVCGIVVGDGGANGWVPVHNAKISINNEIVASTDKNGRYSFFVDAPTPTTASSSDYYKTIIASHYQYGKDTWSGSIYVAEEVIYINFALK